eukprot:scpid14646/ scgid8700/ 
MAETSNCQAEEVRRALRDGAAALEATGRERPATLLRRLRGELVRLQRSSEGFFSSFVGADAGRSEDSPPVPRRNGSLPQKRRRESEESANVAPGKRSCSDRRRVKREERWQAHLAKRGWPAEKPRLSDCCHGGSGKYGGSCQYSTSQEGFLCQRGPRWIPRQR